VFRTVADFISPVTMALYWRGLRPRLWVLCVVCFASRTTDEIAQAYVVGICFMGIYAFVCFVFVRGALRASEIITPLDSRYFNNLASGESDAKHMLQLLRAPLQRGNTLPT
jgi:hypothetical protein